MTNFVRHYNAARRTASPCAAYRAATSAAAAPRLSARPIVRTVTAWTVAAALTLGMGALAAHESTAATAHTDTTITDTNTDKP